MTLYYFINKNEWEA